jgi:hypothetical protein
VRLSRLSLAAVFALVGCPGGQDDTGAPLGAPPEGLLACGQADTAAALMRQLRILDKVPLGQGAALLDEALTGCERFSYGPGRSLDAFDADLLSCDPQPGTCASLERTLGRHAVAFSWSPPEGPTTTGWLDADEDGSLKLGARVPLSAAEGERGLLPAADPPGPAVLSGEGAVFHARLAPLGGLGITSMVESGPQVNRLLELQGRIFQGGVLDGTLETVIYAPPEGGEVPHIAVAVGFHIQRAAIAAIREVVGSLEQQWQVFATTTELEGHEGQCLLELNVMPDFAPCWVATDQALVLGWNQAALSRALQGEPAELGQRSELRVDFPALANAERIMALARGFSEDEPLQPYPWRSLQLQSWRAERSFRYQLVLQAGGAP